MKFNNQTKKQVERDCNLCRGNFSAWLSSIDFDADYAREENIKSHVHNYCPACKIVEKKLKRK